MIKEAPDNKIREQDLAKLARLRPIDDDFMRCIFKDNLPLAQDVLRTVLGIDDLVLVEEETQRDVKRLAGARSVELDVWGVDSKGGVHDIEVQHGDEPDAKRARYHAAAMDVDVLNAGEEFSELPEQWVVFIMEKDPFGEGKGTYHFERAEQDGGRGLGDGSHVLYANGSYRGADKLGELMSDFCQSDPALMNNPLMKERVEYFKSDARGVTEMCEVFEEIRQEGREEARVETRQETLLEALRKMMETLHLTAKEAFDVLAIPEADREHFLAQLQAQ